MNDMMADIDTPTSNPLVPRYAESRLSQLDTPCPDDWFELQSTGDLDGLLQYVDHCKCYQERSVELPFWEYLYSNEVCAGPSVMSSDNKSITMAWYENSWCNGVDKSSARSKTNN